MTCRKSEYNKISMSSKIVIGIMRFAYKITGKKMLDAAFSMKRKDFKIPLFIRKKYKVVSRKILNKDFATIIPTEQDSKLHIIYFHGGAYITQGSIIHWLLINKIINSVKCKVTYIDYPLAPEANYKDTFIMVNSAYRQITGQYPKDRFVFAGDSAGGGLALAFAQSILKLKELKNPIGLVLLSPWLDISMKNKEIENYENRDVILSSKLLIEAAKKYSDGDDLDSPLLSPINGSIDGVGNILMMSGTSEIMYPDCELLIKKAEKAEISMKFSIYRGMPHTWILLFFKESKVAIEEIIEFLIQLNNDK